MDALNVLCIGDSLTAGYSQMGLSYNPYANMMKALLKASWPSTKVRVDIDGMSGDSVVSGFFLPRIRARCKEAKAPYDWIIILGGTNDLGRRLQPKRIFSCLEGIYEVALDHGANVLALTVPECASVSESLNERRGILNTFIKEYKTDKYYTLDIHGLMPYHSMSERTRDSIWDDGLHFTPEGYNVMGEHIAQCLMKLYESLTENEQSHEH